MYVQPATLASLTEATPYDTTLYLAADGSNGGLALSPQEVLVRQATTTYENVTVSVTPLPADSSENAPNGTYRVTAANSAGNIIWDATNEPVRTCVVSNELNMMSAEALAFIHTCSQLYQATTCK